MVSIKRYLNSNAADNVFRQSLGLLIEKLGQSAVEIDPGESMDFRREMESVSRALIPDQPRENVTILVQSAAQALEAYNRRLAGHIGTQHKDFQSIVRTVQSSLLQIAGENAESIRILTRIGDDLERGSGFEDLASLKLHLETCLSGVREHIEQEKATSKATIERLQIVIEGLHSSAGAKGIAFVPAPARDRGACLAAIEAAIRKGTRHYAVVMVVNRIQPINARFGREAGDWMLDSYRKYLATTLLASGQLFRWNGPAMVALLEIPKTLDEVRGAIRRMLGTPLNETYECSGRSILIPISAAWSVFILTPVPGSAEKQIETFIASQYCREFI